MSLPSYVTQPGNDTAGVQTQVCPLSWYFRGHAEDPESLCFEGQWQIFKVRVAS